MDFLVKLFRADGGCNSYLLADLVTRRACVVDPRIDEIDLIEAYLAANKLRLELAIDTHTHADHFSATHLAAEKLGAAVAMSVHTGSGRAAVKFDDGHELEVGGNLAVKTMLTPGHTPDSASIVVSGKWGQLVLTGDTLFIGGSGRTDFPGANAGEQFDSIHNRLGALDARTWVLPGHDYSGLLFSTIAKEKRDNPHLQISDREEFIRMKDAEALDAGCVLQNIVQFNLSPKPAQRPRGGAHAACATVCSDFPDSVKRTTVQELRELLVDSRNSALFVDVREPEEFEKSRIDGMVNIPLSQLFVHWQELQNAPQVYFFCQRGNRSLLALKTARRLGLSNASDVEGGILAWNMAGFQVVRS